MKQLRSMRTEPQRHKHTFNQDKTSEEISGTVARCDILVHVLVLSLVSLKKWNQRLQ